MSRATSVLGATGACAVLAVSLAVSGGSSAGAAETEVTPNFPPGPAVIQHPPSRVANHSGIPGVVAYDTKGYPAPGTPDAGTISHTHVHRLVRYAVTPPVGGPHNEKWLNAGTYTKPVPSSRANHDLEHGTIWITYSPAMSPRVVHLLQAFVHKQSVLPESTHTGNRFMLLSPWHARNLGAPIVISSWGYQLKVQHATDPRLQRFVDTFRRKKMYSPELTARVDGIAPSVGGRPAKDGEVIH